MSFAYGFYYFNRFIKLGSIPSFVGFNIIISFKYLNVSKLFCTFAI